MAEMSARERGHKHLKDAGYSHHEAKNIHGDAPQDRKQIASAVHKHERHMHKGEKETKLRAGGKVHGHEARHRMDRRARGGMIHDDQPNDAMGNAHANSARAHGGHVGKKGGKTVININAGGDQQGSQQREQMAHQAGMQQGAQMGAKMAAAKMAGGPGGGPPGGPPMGAPPGPPMAGGMPPPGGPPPGGMPPRPMMPPPGAPPPGMPPRAFGGAMRDPMTGRFTGGAI